MQKNPNRTARGRSLIRWKVFLPALLLLLSLGAAALALDAYEIDRAFWDATRDDGNRWKHNETREGDALFITEKAKIGGKQYEFGISAVTDGNRACQIYFRGWFAHMKMNRDLTFPAGLTAYNNFLNMLADFVPDSGNVIGLFNSYDIYTTVQNGEPFETGGSWQSAGCSPGKLNFRNPRGPYLITAEKLDNGQFWFSVMLP